MTVGKDSECKVSTCLTDNEDKLQSPDRPKNTLTKTSEIDNNTIYLICLS